MGHGIAHLVEIDSAGLSDGGEIHAGMLMDDVRAQRDVVRRGNVHPIRLIQHAVVLIGEAVGMLVDVAGQRLAIADVRRRAALNGLVHPRAGLLPHAEGAVLDGRGHVLGGAAQIGQLEVVDAARAVAGDVGDIALAHQRDEIGRQAALDDVRAHGEDDLPALRPRPAKLPDQRVEVRASPLARLILSRAL